MRLYNTATRTSEPFVPLAPPVVTFYSCGPTVYDYTHIGHIRTFVNNDVLRRTLTYLGYQVNHVMNTTDVGHLTGDDDAGEDKMERGARAAGKSVWDLAAFYTEYFQRTIQAVNVMPPTHLTPATQHIPQMIALILRLEKNGFTYQTREALYFDVTRFPMYGALSGQKLSDKIQQARGEVNIDPDKRNPADFALWFLRYGRFKDHTMHWDSPWGDGFPGWHIECSAMAMEYLGETIDIHAGGVDHIPVHHENEIAQSEAATGKPFVRYWFHNEFLLVDGVKMSKSLKNFYTIDDIRAHDIDPMAARMLFLQTSYRQQMNFTWDSLNAAYTSLKKLHDVVRSLRQQTDRPELSPEKMAQIEGYQSEFRQALENDLNIPQALAVLWTAIKSNIPSTDKLDLIYEFDQVLGLDLSGVLEHEIPEEVTKLASERQQARAARDFAASDKLRAQIDELGYIILDEPTGYKISKK